MHFQRAKVDISGIHCQSFWQPSTPVKYQSHPGGSISKRCHFASLVLEIIGYYAKCIPNVVEMVEQMRRLLRGTTSFVWDEAVERSYQQLKIRLTSNNILHMYDATLPTIVTADVSSNGIGAVLQVDGEGLRTIAFAPRMPYPQERKYR